MDEAPRFWLQSGHRALDLALSGGPGWRSRWERLSTPEDLADWLAEAPGLEVGRLPTTVADLRAAHRLRAALWDLAQARAMGEPLPVGALRSLNGLAARPTLVARLDRDGVRAWHRPTAARALATIAAEGVELLGGPLAGRVHRCQGERCWLLFLDVSPAGARRWCSMERCGNRTKVRSHRARSQAAEPAARPSRSPRPVPG